MIQLSRKFLPFLQKKSRYKVAYGGRASGKSWSVAICLLLLAKDKKLLIVCAREFQRNLEESVYRLLSNTIRQDAALSAHYLIMSDRIKGRNGSEIVFTGIKSARNFKSFEGADILWIEEAQTISAESMMIVVPTIRKIGSELWFTFNPDSEEDPVYSLITHPRAEQITLNINYTDNGFCSEDIKAEAEHMKLVDYDLYRHVWLGETRRAADNLIFKNKWEIQDFEVEDYFGIPKFNGKVIDMFYGLDFGFVHPCVMIETFRQDGYVYVSNEIVGVEMDMDDITTRYLTEFKYNKNKTMYADSARPDLIDGLKFPRISKEGLQLSGLNIEPANKGAGSVESGLTWLKTHYKIIVHPNCVNTINNLKKYCYKVDKNGIISTTINKINDDCIDALRYAYTPLIGEDTQGIDWNDTGYLKEITSEAYAQW